MRKKYTSVMEKIIKNAVSETTKVLETVIAELKAEVRRVTNENENLKIRCSQFEEVVKKRSVYRETGTSPEPWIIEKCDKAVQFDFILRHLDDDDDSPNTSENEVQSESSFVLIYEKEASSDSTLFSTTKDTEDNSCTPLDLQIETVTETTVDDIEQHKASDSCYESSGMKIQEGVCIKYSETDHSLSECQETTQQEPCEIQNLPFLEDVCIIKVKTDQSLLECHEKTQPEINETDNSPFQEDVCVENSETDQSLLDCQETAQEELNDTEKVPFQEDVCIEYAETDQSSLECQETTQQELNETESLSFEEDVCIEYTETKQSLLEFQETIQQEQNQTEKFPHPDDMSMSTETEDICAKSKAHPIECEFSPVVVVPAESVSSSNALQQANEEMTQMDIDVEQESTLSPAELKSGDSSTADLIDGKFGKNLEQVEPVTSLDNIKTREGPTESEQTCTEIDDREDQSVSPKMINAKAAQNDSHSFSPPKSQYFLRRQRCTSVTLEDAMLLLDAVSQQKYKSSPPKKLQTKESLKHLPTPKSVKIPDGASPLEHNSEDFTCTRESLQMPAIESTADSLKRRVRPINMDIQNQQLKETIWSSKPSWPVESIIEYDVATSTPIKRRKSLVTEVEVTEADSAGLKIDGQHDHQTMSSTEPFVPENTTPNLTPTKLDEAMHGADQTATTDVEEDDKSATSSTQQSLVETSFETNVPNDNESMQAEFPFPIDLSASNVSEKALFNPVLQTSIETVGIPPIQDSNEFQEHDLKTTASSTQNMARFLNPPTQQTMVLKLSGDTGDQSSSVVKTITSSSTLSPAQLSAVVSAVRSTQTRTSPTRPSVVTPSCKKGLVAVPFSLQSVMRPHHKIIVIPRQCKVPSPQGIVKDKVVVLKQKPFAAEATTTFISTTDVNLESTSGENNTINSTEQQQASVTHPNVDTSESLIEPSSSNPGKSQCTNTVQIKLNRIVFPVTSAESVSITDMPENSEPKIMVRKRRGRPPLKKKKMGINSNQTNAQPKEANLCSPLIGPSLVLSSEEATQITSITEEKVISTEGNQSPPPEQLFPVVAKDHSYPQHCMTKSQFLAKLEVSPVTEISKKTDSIEKVAQKASLVDRLRSHLKPHIKTMKKAQTPVTRQEDSSLTVEAKDPISTPTQEVTQPSEDQQNERVPDPVPHNDENKNGTPKTTSSHKTVPNKAPVKRKRSPKRNITPTKTVKRRTVKKTTKAASSDYIPSDCKLSPMRNKIMNSNALLSCVRKGIKKKSFLCKFCRKEFGKKKDIEVHIQIHVGKKPFQCNICHRRFSRTMELSRHLKRHNAEKKFQCTSCGKSFIEYNNLKRHSYIHTGEKPFPCPHCTKSFTQSGHMRSHIKNKHKDVND